MVATILLVVVTGLIVFKIWQDSQTNTSKIEEVLKETVVDVFGLESLALLDEAVKDVQEKLNKIRNVADYEAAVETLKEQLSDLRIKRDEIDAEYTRKNIDVEFKVGLERKRHEQELDLSKRDAVLTVREENLTKDQQRFTDQMKFERDTMKAEMDSLRKLTGQLLERLPDAKILARTGNA